MMAMFNRWSQWMHDRGSSKLIMRGGKLYLHRRYLLKLRSLSVFLHTFWMDDPDPLHDHPWPFGRIILSGHYREYYHDGTSMIFGPGHIVWNRNAQALHRVELMGEPVTTIFWHWARRRQWGFLHPDGWRRTPEEGMDGRPLEGFIFPRKQGPPPAEVVHTPLVDPTDRPALLHTCSFGEYLCHLNYPNDRSKWCDHKGPGGFMGHTCGS